MKKNKCVPFFSFVGFDGDLVGPRNQYQMLVLRANVQAAAVIAARANDNAAAVNESENGANMAVLMSYSGDGSILHTATGNGERNLSDKITDLAGLGEGVINALDQTVSTAETLMAAVLTHSINVSGVNGRSYILRDKWTPFPRANVLSKSGTLKILNTASKPLFIIGTAISVGNGIKAGMNGDIPGVGKASTDIAVGVISFFGGPVGWGTGLSYYVIDVTVGVESATEPLTDFVCKVTDDC